MKRTVSLLSFILLFCAASFSQDHGGKARTGGTVTDEEGNPIEGVIVKLLCLKTESGLEKVTDKNGEWRASWIKGGTWHIDFEKIGYHPKAISTELSEINKNPWITITMEKAEEVLIIDAIKEDFDKAALLYDEENYEEALKVYQGIMEKFPEAYIINTGIGDCYFKLEDYDQAEVYYLKVLEEDPDNTDVIIAVGNCYSNRGDNEKALEWYKKIEIEKIKDPVVLYNIGTYFYNGSQFQEALTYFERAVEIKEDALDAIYQLGLAHLALDNRDAALAQFENYLKHDPDSERAAQVKGFIEYLKKRILEFALSGNV